MKKKMKMKMKTKTTLKLISIVTLCFMLLTMAVSCKKDTSPPNDETTTSDDVTTILETPITLPLIENGETKFTLLKPIGVSDDVLDVILYFKSTFQKKTGITLEMEFEDQNEAVNDDFEIIIGNSYRPESIEKNDGIKSKDYFFGIVKNKLIFAGGSADALLTAVDTFFRNVIDPAVSADKANITLSIENNTSKQGSYFLNSMKIGETDAYNYKIVYSADDIYAAEVFAKRLSESIRSKSGYSIKVVSDKTAKGENEIVIGNTNRGTPSAKENCFAINYDSGTLYMSSPYSEGYNSLLTYFVSNILIKNRDLIIDKSVNVEKDLSLVFSDGSENMLSKTGIRVIFNNVWSGNESTAPAKLRAKQLADVYKDYSPDVIGLQEYSGAVKTELASRLKKMGYVEISYSESNKKGIDPRTPVFYDPNTLNVVASGFWRYGDESGDVSKSIGWAVFEEKASGQKFIIGSTHFYWTSDALGQASRIINANELCELMSSLSAKYDAPVIIGGDYNCNINSDPLAILKNNNFVEAHTIAAKAEKGGTHHSYPIFDTTNGFATSYYPASGTYATAIDHIYLFNEQKLNVHLYDVIEDYFALASSDHCPLLTDFSLK